MHNLCALSTLLLQPLFTASATALLQSNFKNDTSISSIEINNTTPSSLSGINSHPSPTSLIFDLYDSRIPSSAVNAAFSGAITKIYPFLQGQAGDPITNDDFQYRAIGGSVQLGVAAVRHHGISWQQLDDVLRQVSNYMNGGPGEGRPHLQELSFEIIVNAIRVGEGLVLYRPAGGFISQYPPPASLKDANDTKVVLALTNPSLNASTVNGIHYQIPNTLFKLKFGFFGDPIPTSEVWTALYVTLSAHSSFFDIILES